MEHSQQAPPGYVLQSPDTDYPTEAAQFARWRAMDVAEKAELLERWNRAAHELHLQGLRERWPGATERELELRAAAERYGADLIRRLTGFDAGELRESDLVRVRTPRWGLPPRTDG